ncbi:MAG: Gfo/Idh/MocA family oxidoreductase [Kiritimatiellae bacterium]|nr:Gfo/Idh/MocA family oxidoreductase [Kiritimatiellia bacterium]
MDQNRRDFLKSAFWTSAAIAAASSKSTKAAQTSCCGAAGSMMAYAAPPIKTLRVGVIGLGRGGAGVNNFTYIPGSYVSAICDINAARRNRTLSFLKKQHAPVPKVYGDKGAEDWKRLCEDPNVDLVYNATPWELHVPIALYAMKCGKHVAIEVPSAFTVDECWELVKTSEKTKCHCMQLENCCYGESELLAYNLCHLGLLGEITHGEGAYIHDLRTYNYGKWNDKTGGGGYWNYWRLRHNIKHGGNQYPTHGLGPICMDMDINRGDRFDFVVSVDSKQAGFEELGARYTGDSKDDQWRRSLKVKMADMNTSIIRTVNGRTIMVQHNVGTARPYSRLNLIQGTRGVLADYPLRIAIEESLGKGAHNYDPKKTEEIRQKYKHPIWAQADEVKKVLGSVGGHGGMDTFMVLRLSYCLQLGLPLDMNVYDLASWCCLCELTEKSADNRGRSMDIPDFTCGAWKNQKPFGFEAVDFSKLGQNFNTVG